MGSGKKRDEKIIKVAETREANMVAKRVSWGKRSKRAGMK